jgi:hypothetical protein
VITVIVGTGKDQATFVLHEHLLRESSLFFRNALNGAWRESNEKAVKIPDVSAENFTVFARFLFTGLLFITSPGSATPVAEDTPEDFKLLTDRFTAWVKVLQVADYLLAFDFHDAIVDAMLEVTADCRNLRRAQRVSYNDWIIHSIYKYSAANSPVRKLATDMTLHAWDTSADTDRELTNFPEEFVLDILRAYGPFITSTERAVDMRDPINLAGSCEYHGHTLRGEPCYKEKYQYLTKKVGAKGMLKTRS